jgi:hypothetical protein
MATKTSGQTFQKLSAAEGGQREFRGGIQSLKTPEMQRFS